MASDSELVCWLWHCAATAVALKRHERVNAFNLVSNFLRALSTRVFFTLIYRAQSLQCPCNNLLPDVTLKFKHVPVNNNKYDRPNNWENNRDNSN